MNRAYFSGKLYGPININYTQGNIPFASFNLGISDRYRKGDEWHTQWSSIPMEAWGKQTEYLAGLEQGDEIFVECTARQDNWVDKTTGEKRYKLKFRIIQVGQIIKHNNTSETSSASLSIAEEISATPF